MVALGWSACARSVCVCVRARLCTPALEQTANRGRKTVTEAQATLWKIIHSSLPAHSSTGPGDLHTQLGHLIACVRAHCLDDKLDIFYMCAVRCLHCCQARNKRRRFNLSKRFTFFKAHFMSCERPLGLINHSA